MIELNTFEGIFVGFFFGVGVYATGKFLIELVSAILDR